MRNPLREETLGKHRGPDCDLSEQDLACGFNASRRDKPPGSDTPLVSSPTLDLERCPDPTTRKTGVGITGLRVFWVGSQREDPRGFDARCPHYCRVSRPDQNWILSCKLAGCLLFSWPSLKPINRTKELPNHLQARGPAQADQQRCLDEALLNTRSRKNIAAGIKFY